MKKMNLVEIEGKYCFNDYRKKLFKKAKKGLKSLISAGVLEIWLDGSFIGNKEKPNDIDVCWLPNPSVDSSKIDPVLLDFSKSRAKMKKKYGLDCFPANVIESSTGKPFLDFFKTDRDGSPKEIIKLKLE